MHRIGNDDDLRIGRILEFSDRKARAARNQIPFRLYFPGINQMLPSFCSSTRTFQGQSATEVMASELQRFNSKRVLFVTDVGVYAAGLTKALEASVPRGCDWSACTRR